jgi:hypothetical protein
MTRLQCSFDLFVEAPGETEEVLGILAGGLAVGEQAEFARVPGIDVQLIQCLDQEHIDIERHLGPDDLEQTAQL